MGPVASEIEPERRAIVGTPDDGGKLRRAVSGPELLDVGRFRATDAEQLERTVGDAATGGQAARIDEAPERLSEFFGPLRADTGNTEGAGGTISV